MNIYIYIYDSFWSLYSWYGYIYIYTEKKKICMIIYIYPVLKCFERIFHHGLQPVMC